MEFELPVGIQIMKFELPADIGVAGQFKVRVQQPL
jgi:hypothetical protein